jgi:striatin 1/3/4
MLRQAPRQQYEYSPQQHGQDQPNGQPSQSQPLTGYSLNRNMYSNNSGFQQQQQQYQPQHQVQQQGQGQQQQQVGQNAANGAGGSNGNAGNGSTTGDGQSQANGAAPGQEMNLAGVLHYLQSEWRRWERDRNEWEIERAEMRVSFPPVHTASKLT